MSPRVADTVSARSEVTSAARWYDGQRRGAGQLFRAAVQACAADIAAMPFLHPVTVDDIHEAPLARYRYLIYSRAQPTRILVVAVRHTARQDPAAGLGDDPTE